MISCTTINTTTTSTRIFSSPTRTAQNLEDPLLYCGDDLAFGVETRDKIGEISQGTEVNTEGVVGRIRIGLPDEIQDLLSSSRPISLSQMDT